MARIHSTCLAFALCTTVASAQITVTNSVFPVIGDTLHYAFGNQPNAITAVFTPPGGNQVWDLSGLQADSTWQQTFVDPQSGAGQATYPEATMMATPVGALAGPEDYLTVSASEVGYLGSHGVDPLQLGSSWSVRWNPSLPLQRAPLNFFDIYQVNTGTFHYFQPSEMPPGWTEQFNTNDSIRMRTAMNHISVVDAWGTLTIPGGSYEVLREKRTTYTETLVDAKIAPLGWLDVTDVCINQYGLGAVLGLDTTVTFHFINDLSKETIAVCDINAAQNEVLRVRYKVADFTTATQSAWATAGVVRVFPNPSTDKIQVQAPQLGSGAYHVLVVDARGRAVMRSQGVTGAHGLQLELDITAFDAGIYRGAIAGAHGAPLEFRFTKW